MVATQPSPWPRHPRAWRRRATLLEEVAPRARAHRFRQCPSESHGGLHSQFGSCPHLQSQTTKILENSSKSVALSYSDSQCLQLPEANQSSEREEGVSAFGKSAVLVASPESDEGLSPESQLHETFLGTP